MSEPTREGSLDAESKTTQSLSSIRSLLAGGIGGLFAVLVGHPFDLVKVRLQTASKGEYRGAIEVMRKAVAREGFIRGMYGGVSAPLLGSTPILAVSFWGYGIGKQLVQITSRVEGGQFTPAQVAAAGFFSAIPMAVFAVPFERVKIILQIQGQKQRLSDERPKYSGAFDVVRQLIKEGGIRSVYRGSAMTLARDGPGSAAYFATYEILKRKLTSLDSNRKPDELSPLVVCTAGGAAGVAMWTLVFPMDTIKSRMQSGEGNLGVGATLKELYGERGLKGFFPGLGPAMARAVPANAATFLGVELAHAAMNHIFG